MVPGVSGWEIHPGKKGIGRRDHQEGKGTKLMVVADGNGLPIGVQVASVRPHELTLAHSTLEMVKVAAPAGASPAAPPGVGGGQGVRQSMVALQGDQAGGPADRMEKEAGASSTGGAGLPGVVEGGTALCLAGTVSTVGGPP